MREGKAEATERKRRKVVSWKTLQEQSKELLALVLGVMEMWSARVVVLLVATILLHARAGLVLVCGQEFGLETSFYRHSCPAAEIIIRETVADAFQSDSTIVAGLLRMLFHDCFVEVIPCGRVLDLIDGIMGKATALPPAGACACAGM